MSQSNSAEIQSPLVTSAKIPPKLISFKKNEFDFTEELLKNQPKENTESHQPSDQKAKTIVSPSMSQKHPLHATSFINTLSPTLANDATLTQGLANHETAAITPSYSSSSETTPTSSLGNCKITI